MKKKLNDKGIALITALVLSLVAMALIAALMQLILTGTKMSGYLKSYTTALESAKGGVEYFISSISGYVYHKGMPIDTNVMCKIQQDTKNWSESCKGYIKANNRINSVSDLSSDETIDDIINYYDNKLDLGNYEVYMKLVDARGSSSGKWYYTFDVVSENKNNLQQRAWIVVFLRTN